jgi:hypothetical protein
VIDIIPLKQLCGPLFGGVEFSILNISFTCHQRASSKNDSNHSFIVAFSSPVNLQREISWALDAMFNLWHIVDELPVGLRRNNGFKQCPLLFNVWNHVRHLP